MNYFERFIFGKNISYAEEIIFPSSTYRRCYKQHCTKVCGRSEYEFFCKFLINDGNVSLEDLMKNVKYVNDEVRFKIYKVIIDRYKIDEYYDVKDNNEAKKSKNGQNDESEQCKRDENKLENNLDNKDDVNNVDNNIDNIEDRNNIENDIKEISFKKFKEILSKNKKDNKIVKFLEQDEKAEDIFYILKNIIQRYRIIEIHKLNLYSHNEDNKDNKDNKENDNSKEDNNEDNKENDNNKDNSKEDDKDNNEINTNKEENINKNNNQDENDNTTTSKNNHDNITDDNHDNTVDTNNDLSINISILIAYIKHFISLPNATTIEVYKLMIILIKKYNFFINYNKDNNKEERNINGNNTNINDNNNNIIINRNYLESKLEPKIYKLFTDPQFQLFFYKKLILNKSTADKLIDIIVLMDIVSLD
ncbi:hypothetical protein SLOPH_889, partial [Spraguea lophii 42_110]